MSVLRSFVAVVLASSSAPAAPEETPAIVHVHMAEAPCAPADLTVHRHLGFYLHLDNGVGGMRTSSPGGFVSTTPGGLRRELRDTVLAEAVRAA